MRSFLLATLVLASVASAAVAQPVSRKPVIIGGWWRICEMPDLGELNGPDPRKQHIVDHGFIQGADGMWTLWACMRGTKPGRILFGWQGRSLEDGPWSPVGVVARADSSFGEKTAPEESIQAPFFLKDPGRFLCFYNSNGIRLMTSGDGHHYRRELPGRENNLLYADGGRDVMVMRHDGQYFAYSTVSTTDGRGYVILRKSRDLRDWTPAKIVCEGGRAGGGPVSAESPFVVPLDGFFYLFRASSVDGKTYVYRSADPGDFGVNDDSRLITTLPVKAPEFIHHEGQWFISDLADFKGVKLARLEWPQD